MVEAGLEIQRRQCPRPVVVLIDEHKGISGHRLEHPIPGHADAPIRLAVDADVLIFADSDVTFIRPFGPSHVVKEGRVRLHRIPGAGRGPGHLRWNRKAAELLGLSQQDYFGYDYIGQLVSWRRENVLQLHRRLETIGGGDWYHILCNTLHFAEYILYGVFVEHVLGEQSGHYFDSEDLCHCSWHYNISNNRQLEDFLKQVKDRHVAVLVQSHLNFAADTVASFSARE